MKFPLRFRSPRHRAFALITVMMFVGAMAILTVSILRYSGQERRLNERNRLVFRARNMTENISIYAAEQLTNKLYRLRTYSSMAFMGGSNEISLPPANVLTTNYSTTTGMEVRAGITSQTNLTYIDPTLPANASNPNAGLSVATATIPIISKATMNHPSIGNVTAYAQHDMEVALVPLFQFAMFYNMDLEVSPGGAMLINGPVHTNGNLITRCQTGTTVTIEYTDRVTAAGGLFANTAHKGPYYNENGTADVGPGGTGILYFTAPNGTKTNLYNGAIWRDHKYGTSTETATTLAQFKTFATSTYGGNLRTSVHGVTKLALPSVSAYSETNLASTADDDRNNGREIIAPPATTDSGALLGTKFARNAGLYIVVNPDDEQRVGKMPDGTNVTMRAKSYRCWLNRVNSDGTYTFWEVILPGQPSYGPLNANVNNLPNRYTDLTAVGHNQVFRIPQHTSDAANTGYTNTAAPTMASFQDAYFYDLRRAINNRGGAPYDRPTYNYTPRPVVKLDFDLTRFRMMVERTISGTPGSYIATDTSATIYYPSLPTTTTQWNASVFNPSAAQAAHGLGLGASFNTFPTSTTLNAQDPFRMYFAPADPADTLISTNPGTFAVGTASLVTTSGASPWFDGITVYVHSVDAETRAITSGAANRIDSGVRLWNGRGPIASLDGTTYPGRTGFAFASNDVVYVVGHFNADGSINATSTDTTNPGGYSARYPENTSERLCSIMGDAITVLSQPVFNSSYRQINGWSDSLSAHRKDTATQYTTAWASTNPNGSTNRRDGVNTSFAPAAMPNMGNTVAGGGTAVTAKFSVVATEISAAMVTGIVPTNHNASGLTDGPPIGAANNQHSGGAHNFPRLLEAWAGTGLYIRGSMVAMFESRVAMEPWTLSPYTAAGRFWGLHQSFRSASHDLPLEPVLLNCRRRVFKEITAAEYSTMKTTIEALPH
ncbi:MAG: hypothetical protein JNL39_15900 [Opitutaceae bacterium]|nr:hypothetical protein [Opitutaceae bacterium]